MKREFKVWVGLVMAMALSAIALGQTVSINGKRVMSGLVGTPSDGQIAVWSAALGQWVTGSALTSTAVNTNGSVTWFGSVQDTGWTITNNANGNYRWSLPATGLSGQYGFNFSGSNVTLTATTAGVAGADTQVQFNDGGSLAGNAGLVFNKTTHAVTATGSVLGSDVNATAAGDGVLSLTNSARTFIYRRAPHGTMTANVYETGLPAAATGFYYGTASASTNEVQSIKASIDLSTADASGTLAAARMPALTGDITTSAGGVATTLATVASAGTYRSVTVNVKGLVTAGTTPTTFSGYAISDTSANLAAALTDESGTGQALFSTALYQTKTGNYTVLATESNSVFDNSGAAGTITLTLPTAVAGMTYQFIVVTAQSLTVKAGAGATIRNLASVSASAGTLAASTVGNVVTIRAMSATTWIVVSIQGTWTLT